MDNEYGIYAACGDGWMRIILDTHKKLLYLDPDYRIDQIKEKFGGLRYYYTPSVKASRIVGQIMDDVVSAAENNCYRTCEMCGGSGYDVENKRSYNVETRVLNGWYYTYCELCSDKRVAERKARYGNAD